MQSPHMNKFAICAICLFLMFEAINTYEFSFMGVPALLTLLVLFVALMFFIDSWFYYSWGFFTGFVILIPMIIELFNGSNQMSAFLFDGILSVFLIGYFGYKLYKKYNIEINCRKN